METEREGKWETEQEYIPKTILLNGRMNTQESILHLNALIN
jgi:hypothetical protein